MKTLLLLSSLFVANAASARGINYVSHSLGLPAVKALKLAFPVCKKPNVASRAIEGLTNFTITQACKKSASTPDDSVNDSVVITITGTSAPWGELGDIEVKVGTFCAGNCEL